MNNIDKQYQSLLQDILGDAYKNYEKKVMDDLKNWDVSPPSFAFPEHREVFINKIKTDNEFANRWGVDVSVRELSHTERYWLWNKISGDRCTPDCYTKEDFDNKGIPTRAISFTYNNETVESYE